MTPLTIEFSDNRPVRHVLNVSGGKDSSALALLMAGRVKGLEHFRHDGMEYVFCDRHVDYSCIRILTKCGYRFCRDFPLMSEQGVSRVDLLFRCFR